jgi:hypothetical protein
VAAGVEEQHAVAVAGEDRGWSSTADRVDPAPCIRTTAAPLWLSTYHPDSRTPSPAGIATAV